MTRNEALTAAFNEGYAHRQGGGPASRRLRVAVRLRTFWEAGYEKADREIAAAHEEWLASPEGLRETNKQRRSMERLYTTLALVDQGRYAEARKVINEELNS
jgi:hypothetical protein